MIVIAIVTVIAIVIVMVIVRAWPGAAGHLAPRPPARQSLSNPSRIREDPYRVPLIGEKPRCMYSVSEGSLAGFFVRHHLALELVSGG